MSEEKKIVANVVRVEWDGVGGFCDECIFNLTGCMSAICGKCESPTKSYIFKIEPLTEGEVGG